MDPISLLGAAAAAAQVVAQGIAIAKFLAGLYTKTQEAPEVVQKQLGQIQQLIGLSRLVIENKALQTDSIASVVRSCLKSAETFHGLLTKIAVKDGDGKVKKLQKALAALMSENEIGKLFDDLEREKSLLTLCIQEVDSKFIQSISRGLDDVKIDLGSISRNVDIAARDSTAVANMLPQVSSTVTEIHSEILKLTLRRKSSLQPPGTVPLPDAVLKNYFVVPNRRVTGFLGRDDILSRIETAFVNGDSPCIVVVRAMGGQGKTQVALEFCERSKMKHFKSTFWFDATSENTLKKGFETIAQKIKSPDQVLQEEAGVEFVMEKLGEWPEPWLIVFDNYDDPLAYDVRDYIPVGDYGCILVTTRHAYCDDMVDPPENAIELPPLREDHALELLFKQSRTEMTQAAYVPGKAIAKRLGYHPLAITQAGSYIRLRKIKFKDFMDHYDRQRETILQQTPQMTQYRRKLNDADKETALNVFTTWELSFA